MKSFNFYALGFKVFVSWFILKFNLRTVTRTQGLKYCTWNWSMISDGAYKIWSDEPTTITTGVLTFGVLQVKDAGFEEDFQCLSIKFSALVVAYQKSETKYLSERLCKSSHNLDEHRFRARKMHYLARLKQNLNAEWFFSSNVSLMQSLI